MTRCLFEKELELASSDFPNAVDLLNELLENGSNVSLKEGRLVSSDTLEESWLSLALDD